MLIIPELSSLNVLVPIVHVARLKELSTLKVLIPTAQVARVIKN